MKIKTLTGPEYPTRNYLREPTSNSKENSGTKNLEGSRQYFSKDKLYYVYAHIIRSEDDDPMNKISQNKGQELNGFQKGRKTNN